jgi:hypothetical protein
MIVFYYRQNEIRYKVNNETFPVVTCTSFFILLSKISLTFYDSVVGLLGVVYGLLSYDTVY